MILLFWTMILGALLSVVMAFRDLLHHRPFDAFMWIAAGLFFMSGPCVK